MKTSVDHAIEAADLVKTYPGDIRALDGLSLSVPAGTIFALLGPNGAGKSTTVRILTTLSRADLGTARVAGHDVVLRGGAGAGGAPERRKAELRGDAINVELAFAANGAVQQALSPVPGIRELVVDGTSLRARAAEGGRAGPLVPRA